MRWLQLLGILSMILPPLSFAGAQDASEDVFTASRATVRTETVFLQADQLTHDSAGDRIITEGNVEIHCDHHILKADRVVFDGARNILMAEGNVVLSDPKGNVIRADAYAMHDSFRDTVVRSLKTTIEDNRIAAPSWR